MLPSFSGSATAAGTKTTSVAIPTQSFTGAANAQKSFLLDLPPGVSPSSITSGSLKYNGPSGLVSLGIEGGKIKVTLNGSEQKKIIEDVEGFRGSYGAEYFTNPGNSIWRYSDGKRWQINKYNITKDSNDYAIVTGTGSSLPYDLPQTPAVVTRSDVAIDYVKWYNGSVSDVIDNNDIIQSTIRLNGFYPPNDATVNVKDNKFIISYTAPAGHQYIPEDVPESVAVGPMVVGRRYVLPFYYHFYASAKVTSYNYSGNVTFEYALPDGPSLSGYVTVLKPYPNPTKFAGTDVDVQLSIKGQLSDYTDSSNISEWVFYAKKKGSSTVTTQKDYQKALTSTSKPFVFTISKTDIASVVGNYQQAYDLTVTVRFTKPIVTKTGTITELTEKLGSIIEVYKVDSSIDFPTPSAKPDIPKGKPPVASLYAPPIVKAGEEFQANGSGSYDPDGQIVGYYFAAPGGNIVGYTPTGSQATLWYPNTNLGQNSIGLTVSDKDMMTDSTGTFVEVVEPIPVADLDVGGTLKENRKVVLTSTSSSPKHYPLVDAKTKITIAAVPGGGGSDASIKYSGSLTGVSTKDILFKQPGLYKAAIAVENTLGYKATKEITFEIVPDEVPYIGFSMQGSIYRDPQNGNKAVVGIDDMSYSPDGDIIDQRTWEYRYDSDNDGSFDDESWVIFSNGNEHNLDLVLYEVGRYEIRHTAYEKFGQPTIDTFITAADRRYADSSKVDMDQKTLVVLNLAPEGNWSW